MGVSGVTEATGKDDDYRARRDQYLWDGLLRRQTHEFGVTGFKLYDEFLKIMDFRPGHIAADIGAGMGDDGRTIAQTYKPAIVYMVEPKTGESDFVDRYYPLELDIDSHADDVKLLPVITEDQLRGKRLHIQPERLNASQPILQPLEARAENLPFEDGSLDRITMIHSGYEFADFEKALQEAARTLNPNGGIGGLITNGAGDKSVLKRKLGDTGRLLQEAYSDQVVYETPNTVSSKLTLLEARSRLRQYFNKVILFTYHDRMKIDEGYRSYVYYHGFDTYRYYFEPPIHNYEDWAEARDEAYSEEYQVDPSGKKILYDTIDTGWILFSDPK